METFNNVLSIAWLMSQFIVAFLVLRFIAQWVIPMFFDSVEAAPSNERVRVYGLKAYAGILRLFGLRRKPVVRVED